MPDDDYDIYNGFKRTMLMELVETRIDELSDAQVLEIFETVKKAEDEPFTLPKPAKKGLGGPSKSQPNEQG
jgi:hypothetical protein